jgi:hypothetical protein
MACVCKVYVVFASEEGEGAVTLGFSLLLLTAISLFLFEIQHTISFFQPSLIVRCNRVDIFFVSLDLVSRL